LRKDLDVTDARYTYTPSPPPHTHTHARARARVRTRGDDEFISSRIT